MNDEGAFFRSPAVKPIILLDRLGGGDTWNAGFYYGLLSENFTTEGLKKAYSSAMRPRASSRH